MNFVKTKIELSSMKSGELLEILLDDGAPIKNVPGSVRSEGHDVLEEKQNEDFWSVLIRKQ
jgi:sulfite reductase (ferredoxin)